jgi:hypothetical protein
MFTCFILAKYTRLAGPFPKDVYQGLGISCFYIANKHYEVNIVRPPDLSYLTDNSVSVRQMLDNETEILNKLGWRFPVAIRYILDKLEFYIQDSKDPDVYQKTCNTVIMILLTDINTYNLTHLDFIELVRVVVFHILEDIRLDVPQWVIDLLGKIPEDTITYIKTDSSVEKIFSKYITSTI